MADDGERKEDVRTILVPMEITTTMPRRRMDRQRQKQLQKAGYAIAKGLLSKKALENPETKRILVNITAALRSPGYLFKKLPDSVSVSTRRFSAGGMIIGANAVLHFILEAWGRRYESMFNSFHDHEHLPGFLLVFIRLVHASVFVVGGRTAIACRCRQAS